MTTWRVALAEAADRLNNPMDARRLVEHVLTGTGARSLHLLLDDQAPASALDTLAPLVRRRALGEPLQHVLGVWGFRTLEVAVDGRALVPRPETEIVTEHALHELDRVALLQPGQRLAAADLGTGSGVIALSLAAERPGVEVYALDISSDALALAEANCWRQAEDVARRVHCIESDWFAGLPTALLGSLAVVVSNPPYLADDELAGLDPVVRDYDPIGALIAGANGLEAIARVIAGAAAWLVPGGALVVEIAPHQREAVLALTVNCGHEYARAFIAPDLSGRDRVLVARKPAP